MLRRAALVIVKDVVTRLDENVGVGVGGLSEILRELVVAADVADADAFERRDHGELVAGVEAALHALGCQGVEDRAVLEAEAESGLPDGDFGGGRAVIEASG